MRYCHYAFSTLLLGKINGTLSPSANNLSSLSNMGQGNGITTAPSTPTSPGLSFMKKGGANERGTFL